MEPIYCDVCGKNTTMEDGDTSVQGMTIELHNNPEHPEHSAFVQKQLGPYEIGRRYVVCFECLLRALGIPEPKG